LIYIFLKKHYPYHFVPSKLYHFYGNSIAFAKLKEERDCTAHLFEGFRFNLGFERQRVYYVGAIPAGELFSRRAYSSPSFFFLGISVASFRSGISSVIFGGPNIR